jgi:hypothetical protein
MIALYLTTSLPLKVAILLFAAAFSEELVRNFVFNAWVAKKWNTKDMVIIACLTALGFTLAEKGVLLMSIAPYLQGFEILITSAVIFPFLMHASFSFGYMYLIRKCNNHVAVCFVLALIHAGINFAIISVLGVSI